MKFCGPLRQNIFLCSDRFWGSHRRKVDETSYVIFLLCDHGWYVQQACVQNKWGKKTHTHTYDDWPGFSYHMPCRATSTKPSTFKAGKTDNLYTRHFKVRDRNVLSNLHLKHKLLDVDVIDLFSKGRKSH